MELNYPKEFAESKWIPFEEKRGLAVQDLSFSKSEFMADPYFRFSIPDKHGSRYEYTDAEMDRHWEAIEIQRKRIQAYWLVSQGLFPAYNPAREHVEAA